MLPLEKREDFSRFVGFATTIQAKNVSRQEAAEKGTREYSGNVCIQSTSCPTLCVVWLSYEVWVISDLSRLQDRIIEPLETIRFTKHDVIQVSTKRNIYL